MIDAIVLAGGRSSRLGGIPKAALEFQSQTLLEHAVATVGFARRTVVVGEPVGALPSGVLQAREEPAFGGPAAGVEAGLARLSAAGPPSDFTLVLACDMPTVEAAVAALRHGLPIETGLDGLISVDGNQHPQPLAALYRTASLGRVISEHVQAGELHGSSMFSLIAPLALAPITVPPGSTDDIDTWEDASRFGIIHPEQTEES